MKKIVLVPLKMSDDMKKRHYPVDGNSFIEYENEINAGSALVGLNKMKLTENSILKITFAKK